MTARKTILSALGATALCATGAMAQEVTLKLHQFLPAQANVPAQVLDVWADKVEEASEGRIEIERYPSMQLGGTPPELMDQAIDGVADIVWTVVGYTPGRFPSTEVFELPFMVEDARAGRGAQLLVEPRGVRGDAAPRALRAARRGERRGPGPLGRADRLARVRRDAGRARDALGRHALDRARPVRPAGHGPGHRVTTSP